ncbi:MAG: hypothetical protein WC045_02925 [Patescibacteria group bacterium]
MTARRDIPVKQQLIELIKNNNRIAVIPSGVFDPDVWAAALSFTAILETAGKTVDLVSVSQVPDNLKKLSSFVKSIVHDLHYTGDTVIRINSAAASIEKLRYEKNNDGGIELIITPKQGVITKDDITIEAGSFPYELVVVFGIDQLSESGLSQSVLAHIQKVPIISISRTKAQRDFAGIDFFDPHATTVSEMIPALAESWDKTLLNSNGANALYTGLLNATDFFQNSRTTSKLLTVAAQLLAIGARKGVVETKTTVEKVDSGEVKEPRPQLHKEIKKEEAVKKDNPIAPKSTQALTEDELYAPSLSDIEQESPTIIDEAPVQNTGPSILGTLLASKSKRAEPKIDFASLEQSVSAQANKTPDVLGSEYED